MRSLTLMMMLCAVPAAARSATIWSCAMDTARETARFAVEGDRLRDLRASDLLHDYGLPEQVGAVQPAQDDSFRILEDTADDLIAVRIAARYEPAYADWLHVGLIMIDKHTGRLTARTTFQKGAVGYAPQDGNGSCTAGID